jgi:uncharacterized protein
MDITPPLLAGANFINGYSDKGFKVNGELTAGHIILTPNMLYRWELDADIFASSNYRYFIQNILSKDMTSSIVLIGTGIDYKSPPNELHALFEQYGISPEVMSTAAACRTYNVLIAEQRNVFALLKKI